MSKCKKVQSNLLQAEVYVRFPVCTIDKQKVKKYVELCDVELRDGVRQKYVEKDYPITPDSVNSYADAADYRRNPEVINQAIARNNLGDITEMQSILNSDMTQVQSLMKHAQEVMGKIQAAQNKDAAPDKTVEQGGQEGQEGGQANG